MGAGCKASTALVTGFLRFKIRKVAVLVVPSSPTPIAPAAAPLLTPAERVVVPPGLLDSLARVPDPRDRRGVRFRLATLLAVGVCDDQRGPRLPDGDCRVGAPLRPGGAGLGCPFDPFTGRFRAPGERTLRDVFA